MKSFIDAVKNNDLVEAKKVFNQMMQEATAKLVEDEKIKIAKSVVVEGEEKEETEDDEDKEKDKKDKDEKED
ncbi:prohead [Morganella phage vB_MmoM_MP1]|uniref:Prohead core protein n=1 Tax=Morganella phage vB_MmoM_MP1 TaxID=1852628 RepID=A0A192YCM1_9CAUD|nr:prohead [Morganella phage vB_MmoM_MP1]ANM46631.1 prohead core protein [Morganella phage vB_MmoM_MP1]